MTANPERSSHFQDILFGLLYIYIDYRKVGPGGADHIYLYLFGQAGASVQNNQVNCLIRPNNRIMCECFATMSLHGSLGGGLHNAQICLPHLTSGFCKHGARTGAIWCNVARSVGASFQVGLTYLLTLLQENLAVTAVTVLLCCCLLIVAVKSGILARQASRAVLAAKQSRGSNRCS